MKLKTRKNKIIKENNQKNFFNNQNYILGKKEKKKILTKFFTEKFIFNYNKIFKYINTHLPNGLLIYLIIFFGVFIVIPYSIGFYPKNKIISIFFTLGILFYSYFMFKDYIIFKWFKYKYSYKNYFLITKYSYFHFFMKYILIIFLILKFVDIHIFISIPIFYILFYIISFFLIFLDFFKILFFPFGILISFLIFIYSAFYTFIFRGIKGYKIIKNIPETKILTKFNKVDEKYAENKYYKITIKN